MDKINLGRINPLLVRGEILHGKIGFSFGKHGRI